MSATRIHSTSNAGDANAPSTDLEAPEYQIATNDMDATFMERLASPRGIAAPAGPAIAAPDFTYRHNWGLKKGWWTLTLNGPFNARWNVFVSASELDDQVTTTDPVQDPMMGSARFAVYNVVPRNGSVQVRVHIDWPDPIWLQLSYLVIRP